MTTQEQIQSLQDGIAHNLTLIAEWRALLVKDAAEYDAPESYSVDGESTTTNEWREGLMRNIKAAVEQITADRELIVALQGPWMLNTKHVMR